MSDIRTAIVIGGGIAGPVTAAALRAAGIEAMVFEASTAVADSPGSMLTVAPNGLDALRVIGADQAVRAIGLPMTSMIMTDGRGRQIGEMPGLPDLEPSRAVWRGQLSRALRTHAERAGIPVEDGKRLVRIDDSTSEVIAHFDDGSSASADILIGADGIHSRVRSLIDPTAPAPRQVPLLNFGATADVSVPARSDAMYFSFGKHGFLGYWAQPDGSTAWFSNLPSTQQLSLSQAQRIPNEQWLTRLREAYADDSPGRDILAHTSPDQLAAFGSTEIMPSAARWHRGRVVLVGDAAHAPSPSSGQGASLAIESGVQLAQCLRDIPDPALAFTRYEELRRGRVERVAARAAKTNNSKALGPMATRMMSLLMPLMVKTVMRPERTLGAEQRFHIDWNSSIAA